MRYRLQDGTYAPHRDVNNHHVFFEKRWYKSQAEHRFRNLGGLVLPMHIPVHDELHANVPPPPKPTPAFREQITEYAHGDYHDGQLEAFFNIAHFIGDVANTSWSTERAQEAYTLHENLMAQAEFIVKGIAIPISEAA